MAERTNIATRDSAYDESPERRASVIRQDIAARRESISETVDKLEERIQETFDWRQYVASYPVVALGLAAGIGFLAAGLFKRNPTPQERIMDAVADLTDDLTGRVGDVMAGVIQKKMISGRTVKAAAATMITKAAVDFAKKKFASAITGDNRDRATLPANRSFSSPDIDLQPSSSSAANVGG